MATINGILAAAAGVAETEAAELVTTDEGIETLQTKISAKLADIKKNADGRALKTTRKAVEDTLRAKGISEPSFDKLADHLEELEGKVLETAATGKGLTDEQVLQHPAVKALKNQLALDADRKVQAATTEAEKALQTRIQAFEQQQTETVVRSWAEQQVTALNPVFSSNPAVAANQRKDLVEKLVKAAKWKKEGDTLQMYDDNDELLKDAAENIIRPEAKARDIITSYYELPVSTHKESPGITPEQARKAAPTTYAGPKDDAEYQAELVKLNTAQERQALTEKYEAHKKETSAAA